MKGCIRKYILKCYRGTLTVWTTDIFSYTNVKADRIDFTIWTHICEKKFNNVTETEVLTFCCKRERSIVIWRFSIYFSKFFLNIDQYNNLDHTLNLLIMCFGFFGHFSCFKCFIYLIIVYFMPNWKRIWFSKSFVLEEAINDSFFTRTCSVLHKTTWNLLCHLLSFKYYILLCHILYSLIYFDFCKFKTCV